MPQDAKERAANEVGHSFKDIDMTYSNEDLGSLVMPTADEPMWT